MWEIFGTDHLMPHKIQHKSNVPSKTIERPRNCARVVITIEAEVHKDRMKELPGYMTHAADHLRAIVDDNEELSSYLSGMLREFFLEHDVMVLDTKVEVAP